MRRCSGEGAADRLARYGGEEFVLVPATIALRNRRCSADIDGPEIKSGVRITVAIGATEHRRDGTPEEFLQRADAALHRRKAAGRNRVVIDFGAGRADHPPKTLGQSVYGWQQEASGGGRSFNLHMQEDVIGTSVFARAEASFEERIGNSSASLRLCRHSTRP